MARTLPHDGQLLTIVMKWVSQHGGRVPLDQYDMAKMHVLSDFFHILRHGTPIVGGQVAAWSYGPVVRDTYNQAKAWAERGGDFKEIDRIGKASRMVPAEEITEEEKQHLPAGATVSIAKAWEIFSPMGWDESQEFFHNPANYFGNVWTKAWVRGEGTPIDWPSLVGAYEKATRQDYSHIKRLLTGPTDDELSAMGDAIAEPQEFWASAV
jgi:uncharacterized phage-associated protein